MRNTKQASLITIRKGLKNQLPNSLNDGELGLATNTNELYIGNPSNPTLANRKAQGIFPFGNIKVLTEFDISSGRDNQAHFNYTDLQSDLICFSFPSQNVSEICDLNVLSLNIRKPFFPIIPCINDANTPALAEGYTFYQGDIVSSGGIFVQCLNTHVSTSGDYLLDGENNWKIVSLTDDSSNAIPDVRYVTIYAYTEANNGNEYYLVNPALIDLIELNRDNYQYSEVVFGQTYDANSFVKFQNHVYKALSEQTPANALALHMSNNWLRFNDTALNNQFIFDRNILKVENGVITDANYFEPYYNWNNYTFKLQFFDETFNIVNAVTLNGESVLQVDTNGFITVKVDLDRYFED